MIWAMVGPSPDPSRVGGAAGQSAGGFGLIWAIVGLAGGGVTVECGVSSSWEGLAGFWVGAAFLARPRGRAAAAISGSATSGLSSNGLPSNVGFGACRVALAGVDFALLEGAEAAAGEAEPVAGRPRSAGGCFEAGGDVGVGGAVLARPVVADGAPLAAWDCAAGRGAWAGRGAAAGLGFVRAGVPVGVAAVGGPDGAA